MLEYVVLAMAVFSIAINILLLATIRKIALNFIQNIGILANTILSNAKESLKGDIEVWLNSEKGKLALYQIGGLIGNGAKSGIGLSGGRGKFKLEDLAGGLISNFFNQRNTVNSENPPQIGEQTQQQAKPNKVPAM